MTRGAHEEIRRADQPQTCLRQIFEQVSGAITSLVGNPTVGKELFEPNHAVGLYVPLRIGGLCRHEWQDVRAVRQAIGTARSVQNEKIAMIAQMLDEKIGGLAASGPRTWPSVRRWAFSSAVGPMPAQPSQAVRRGVYRRNSRPSLGERDPRPVHEGYHRHQQRLQNSHVPLVSVIVPVLDDVASLEGALESLGDDSRVEIIVVNAGERTPAMIALERAEPYVRWLTSLPGRGRQMNLGARHAHGDWLLFLHADTRLSAGWVEELERAARQSSVVGGSFRFQLDSGRRLARVLERGVAARVRWLDLAYGDQALFIRCEVFSALGGYRELPLMEDVDFVRRMRRKGQLHHSTLPAVTSARRWEADGWIRRSIENVILVLLFLAGVPPRWLAAVYRRKSTSHADRPHVTAARNG